MVANDDFDGKATHLNCFYLHINFEQKYPKPAIVIFTEISVPISTENFSEKQIKQAIIPR